MTPQLKITTNPDGTLKISNLAVWSEISGVHGHGSPPEGDSFTAEDLDEMVRAHNEIGGKLRPRMYAGHPLNPTLKMLARPQGEIKRLRREGKFLLADLDGVNAGFWDKARQDGARLSPDVKLGHRDHETGQQYPLSVVGLGVLGAVQPANPLLPALDTYHVTHYALDAAQQRAYGESDTIRSYAGPPIPAADTASPLRAALTALRQIAALGDTHE